MTTISLYAVVRLICCCIWWYLGEWSRVLGSALITVFLLSWSLSITIRTELDCYIGYIERNELNILHDMSFVIWIIMVIIIIIIIIIICIRNIHDKYHYILLMHNIQVLRLTETNLCFSLHLIVLFHLIKCTCSSLSTMSTTFLYTYHA